MQIHLDGILWIIAGLKQAEKLKNLIAETNRHFLHANRYTPSKHIKMGGIIEGSKVKLKFIEHINYAHQQVVMFTHYLGCRVLTIYLVEYSLCRW